MRVFNALLLAACAACACGLRVAPQAIARGAFAPAACSRQALTPMRALPAAAARLAPIRMLEVDEASKKFYDEYVETDPTTGQSKSLSFGQKERLYLECLDSYYNENGKQILSDEDYEQLKLDLDFEGSVVATYSADEIKFVLANKRYKMGKSIMSDTEYDALRAKLKAALSPVVIHEAPSCNLDDGLCKNDLSIDKGKTRLLYLPGTTAGLVVSCEIAFWTLHIDPILSILLGAVPSYFFGVWFTENVFAQKPLVTQSACVNCGNLNTVFFGDLFSVRTDGLAGAAEVPGDIVELKCASCGTPLTADRAQMIVTGEKTAA